MTQTDIIDALREQMFKIEDSNDENVKFYSPREGCSMKLSFNGEFWELGDIEANVNGEIPQFDIKGELPTFAYDEAAKFSKAFNLAKLDLLESGETTGFKEGGYQKFKEPETKWVKPEATKQLVKTKAIPLTMQEKQIQELTLDDIKNYVCPKASDSEAFMFLKLCQARGLNPFTKEAYLVKYGDSATMIVGKEAFAKRAEMNPQYDGFEAGIIVQDENKELAYKEGTFLLKTETLVGGWCKVYRKDRSKPVVTEVSFHEYNTGKSLWQNKPATMIRKVAFVQGHREAFPSECSGMYEAAEMGEEA